MEIGAMSTWDEDSFRGDDVGGAMSGAIVVGGGGGGADADRRGRPQRGARTGSRRGGGLRRRGLAIVGWLLRV
jgi:hypothetical protein